MSKFDHVGNGVYIGEMRGAQFASAIADFVAENRNIRITSTTHVKSETLPNGWIVPFEFVLITESKAQSSK